MRRVLCHLMSILLLAAASVSRAQTLLENLDFEQGRAGEVPAVWFVPTPDYRVVLTEVNPAQGKLCAELSSGDTQKSPFGNAMRSVDATPYRGKVVRLRAAVRVEGRELSDRGQLWLRVDRPNQQMGFFDNMGDRPIRDRSWHYYEITGDVAADAVALNFGLMLITRGQAWLDDVTLEIAGDLPPLPAEPPRPLDERGLDNLVAFARLFGYVRYFHPSDQARDADWEALAVDGVRKVEAAKDAAELARLLGELFRTIAPTVRAFPTGERAAVAAELTRPSDVDGLRVAYWEHSGVGLGKSVGIYHSTRRVEALDDGRLPDGVADPAQPFEPELGGGVSCLVPLALYADSNGTLPRAGASSAPATSQPACRYTGNDRATRLADVILAWNVFQHFYPYFDVVETDWPAELRRALSAAATDKDERAFLDTLRLLVAGLKDGHGMVSHSSDRGFAMPPLLWDWIENRLVVTAVAPNADEDHPLDLKPGDIVLNVNGRPAAEALADVERHTSAATPQCRRWSALQALRRGAPNEPLMLTVQTGSAAPREVTVQRSSAREPPREARPQKIAEVRPGIFYLDVDRISDEDFQAALPQLEKAAGIIFDFRGYPRIAPQTFFPHLTKQLMTSPQWHVPVAKRPDRKDVTFRRDGEWTLVPRAPCLTARRAFIIDGRAISYAESCLGIVEHYKLGEIVGGPTAGTNGNVNPFTLPAGYAVHWTGMKVLKHDGSRHHGVGILPTIPISRTIEGVRQGRDELLERAIEAVSRTP